MAYAIVHGLVGEGADDTVWSWMIVIDMHPPAGSCNKVYERAQRGNILRCFVEAQAYWAPKLDFKTSLETFEQSFQVNKNLESKYDKGYIPKAAAGKFLLQNFVNSTNRMVYPRQYGQFQASLVVWQRNPDERLWEDEKLHLGHPTQPSADPSLPILKQLADLEQSSPFFKDLCDFDAFPGDVMVFTGSSFVSHSYSSDSEGTKTQGGP
jgi:hypothetical protein